MAELLGVANDPNRLDPAVDDVEVDAVASAGHRALGMTFNTLGSISGTSKLIVKGRLERDI